MKRDQKLEVEVRAYLDAFNADVRRSDVKALMSQISPEFLGFGSAADERYDGRDRLMEGLKRDISEVERIERDYKWIKATQRGPLIIFATQYDVHLTVGGRTSVLPARLTGVLERHRGRLRRLQTHMSFPASDSGWPTPIEAVAAAVSEERPDLSAQAAPDGTVTMLFTDIENSTNLTERLGDTQWLDVLREHNSFVREQVKAHGCFEVKSQGDGFMIASQSARRTVHCAIALQRGLLPMRLWALLILALLVVACGSDEAPGTGSPAPDTPTQTAGYRIGNTALITYYSDTTYAVTFLTATDSPIAVLTYSSGPYTFTMLPDRKFLVVTFRFRNNSIRPAQTPDLGGIVVTDRGFEFRDWSPPIGVDYEGYNARPSTDEEVLGVPPDSQAYIDLFPEAESGVGAIIFEIPADQQAVSVKFDIVDKPLLLK